MEGILRVASLIVLGLIVWGIILLAAGGKPKECPPHICYPKEQIVTAEMLIAERQAEAKRKAAETKSAANVGS